MSKEQSQEKKLDSIYQDRKRNIGEEIQSLPKIQEDAKQRIEEHLKNRATRGISEFNRTGNKESGVVEGFIATDGKDTYMIKTSHKNPPQTTDESGFNLEKQYTKDLAREYAFSKLFERLLPGRVPQIGLVTLGDELKKKQAQGKKEDFKTLHSNASLTEDTTKTHVAIRSKFLENFTILEDYSKGKIEDDVEGFEKVVAACILLGDYDYHTSNIGIMEVDGKKVVAKIDHGRAGDGYQYKGLWRYAVFARNGKIDPTIFKQELDQMLQVEESEIDNIISAAKDDLEKIGLKTSPLDSMTTAIKAQFDKMKQLSQDLEPLTRMRPKIGNWMIEKNILSNGEIIDPMVIAISKNKSFVIEEASGSKPEKTIPALELAYKEGYFEKNPDALEQIFYSGEANKETSVSLVKYAAKHNIKPLNELKEFSPEVIDKFSSKEAQRLHIDAKVSFTEMAVLEKDKIKALGSENLSKLYSANVTYEDLKEYDVAKLKALDKLNRFISNGDITITQLDTKKLEALTSYNAIECYRNGIKCEELIKFDIEKLEALTSYTATTLYDKGVSFDQLKELEVEKIKALTSRQAITLYEDGVSFDQLNELEVEKIKALTSSDAITLYEEGVRFDQLKELELDKIKALTSTFSSMCYEKGASFEQLVELDTNKIEALLSYDAYSAYEAGAPFEELTKFEVEKIKALTSYAIPEFSKMGVSFDQLKDLEVDKIKALTSNDAHKLYKKGVSFDQLKELEVDKIKTLTPDDISTLIGNAKKNTQEQHLDTLTQIGKSVEKFIPQQSQQTMESATHHKQPTKQPARNLSQRKRII